jgi:hypothetical protein
MAEDITIQIAYPFAASFGELAKLLPSMSNAGTPVQAQLRAGSPVDISSHDDFSFLSTGTYLANALTATAELDLPVIVYEFTNARTGNTQAVAPTLAASFNIDFDRTEILTYGFSGGLVDTENNFMRQSFFVPREAGHSHFLIIIGEDVTNLSLQGYRNGALRRGDEIDVDVDMRRFETVLSNIWTDLLEDHIGFFTAGDFHGSHEIMLSELFTDATAELFYETQESKFAARRVFFGVGALEDLFGHALWARRVFYLTAEVSIPAEESVSLHVEMIKPGSFDFPPARRGNEGLNGYDLLLTLGSSLTFDTVSAQITGSEYIEIVRDNLGFSKESQILGVNVDLGEPHFYIEVRGVR